MESIRHAIPGALASIVRTAAMSPGKVTFAWRLAVGPSLSRVTTVVLDAGVLIVETPTRAWSEAVSRSSRVILFRLQSLLGDHAVSRIEIRSR